MCTQELYSFSGLNGMGIITSEKTYVKENDHFKVGTYFHEEIYAGIGVNTQLLLSPGQLAQKLCTFQCNVLLRIWISHDVLSVNYGKRTKSILRGN